MVEMDVALEIEDDVFFADLSKQIAHLIMEDEEEEEAAFPLPYPSVSFQAYSHASQPMASSPFYYEVACRREVRGTGVFIPRSRVPRRTHKTGRSRQPEKQKAATPAALNTTTSATNINGNKNHNNSGGQRPFNHSRRSNGLKKQLL